MTDWSVRIRRADEVSQGLDSAASGSRQFVIEESLGYLVNRAARQMAQQLAEELRPMGVGIGQWAVLLFLWARDGMSQADLARVVAIEPPTLVRTLDRMVRDGLVVRVPDSTDGRVTRIQLTEGGRALRDLVVPRAVAVNDMNLGRLTAAEGRTLRTLLAKLVDGAGVTKDGARKLDR